MKFRIFMFVDGEEKKTEIDAPAPKAARKEAKERFAANGELLIITKIKAVKEAG